MKIWRFYGNLPGTTKRPVLKTAPAFLFERIVKKNENLEVLSHNHVPVTKV
uniref:Uncharacterized protein n=1 Tax=Myoviridae sp. ctuev19 TaxID=2827716 RepID=A0A8S5SG93_9CAUD|nr:MAG TPA: hypothetical protein [Myoviridae sp. ctuev19]